MNVCILYGGKSGEHEVSLRSAASVATTLQSAGHRVVAIGIDREGGWHLQERPLAREIHGQGAALEIARSAEPVCVVPGDGIHAHGRRLEIDCVFPVLHGTYGEDGTVQGLLEIAGLPYVGAGVLGSSLGLDKERCKRLWRDAGIPVVEFAVAARGDPPERVARAALEIGYPVCVKPVSAGSSLGVHRVERPEELAPAVADALAYDLRALLERFVDAREIECSVIGNEQPRAFLPGEVLPSAAHRFYDYEAKYTDPDGARLEAPARLARETQDRIMRLAEAAYAAVGCEGMARVDFFLERGSGKVSVNEINSIPGFTSISMFPRMCEASGLPYPKLLDALLDLGLQRSRARAGIRYER
jgi:D-alanine-D-alanine ligase